TVGPPETVATLWAHHDYTTLAPTYLSDRLAQIALVPKRREEILARTRSILQRNYGILADWIRDHGSLFSHIPPTAGAICFLRYALRINSTELAWRLLKEKSTLIVPGAHLRDSPSFTVKVASGSYANPERGLPVGSGIVLVFDSTTGFPRAVLFDNGYLTDLRTGAAGALAADLLARREVDRVGIIG